MRLGKHNTHALEDEGPLYFFIANQLHLSFLNHLFMAKMMEKLGSIIQEVNIISTKLINLPDETHENRTAVPTTKVGLGFSKMN